MTWNRFFLPLVSLIVFSLAAQAATIPACVIIQIADQETEVADCRVDVEVQVEQNTSNYRFIVNTPFEKMQGFVTKSQEKIPFSRALPGEWGRNIKITTEGKTAKFWRSVLAETLDAKERLFLRKTNVVELGGKSYDTIGTFYRAAVDGSALIMDTVVTVPQDVNKPDGTKVALKIGVMLRKEGIESIVVDKL